MKIGILTLDLGINYGGILQAWALQKVLKRMGHDAVLLKRQPGYPSLKLFVMRCLSILKCLFKKYFKKDRDVIINNPFTPYYRTYYFNEKCIKCFINSHISVSGVLRGSRAIYRYVMRENIKAVIAGSDQVWREEYSPSITDSFFAFLPKGSSVRRIAYAASFGTKNNFISAENLPICRTLLQRFDRVSVRELSGVEIIRRDFGREQVEKVLDPTMLLSASDYKTLIESQDHYSDPFVGTYILDDSADKELIVSEVADALDKSVERVSISYISEMLPSVSQWLAIFDDADFIVTDSFHGCVFSILFNKPFIAIANKDRGVERFVSILDEMQLKSRLVYSYSEFKDRKSELMASMNYEHVNDCIKILQHRSFIWLEDALK